MNYYEWQAAMKSARQALDQETAREAELRTTQRPVFTVARRGERHDDVPWTAAEAMDDDRTGTGRVVRLHHMELTSDEFVDLMRWGIRTFGLDVHELMDDAPE
jgi:hypothetical protein